MWANDTERKFKPFTIRADKAISTVGRMSGQSALRQWRCRCIAYLLRNGKTGYHP